MLTDCYTLSAGGGPAPRHYGNKPSFADLVRLLTMALSGGSYLAVILLPEYSHPPVLERLRKFATSADIL